MAGDLSIPEMLLHFQLDLTSKDIQRAPGTTYQASLWYKTVAAGLDECARLVGLPMMGPRPLNQLARTRKDFLTSGEWIDG